jgi:hypothetical protein
MSSRGVWELTDFSEVTAVASLLRHYSTSRKVAGSGPSEVYFFQLTYSFQPHYDPGVDSASNRNEYQEFSLG